MYGTGRSEEANRSHFLPSLVSDDSNPLRKTDSQFLKKRHSEKLLMSEKENSYATLKKSKSEPVLASWELATHRTTGSPGRANFVPEEKELNELVSTIDQSLVNANPTYSIRLSNKNRRSQEIVESSLLLLDQVHQLKNHHEPELIQANEKQLAFLDHVDAVTKKSGKKPQSRSVKKENSIEGLRDSKQGDGRKKQRLSICRRLDSQSITGVVSVGMANDS
eukprot:TRINITY_DN5131_c0_g1_i8.p1 TRINITY_DN5131_c0_g1~~TRINITY_DN5131_c0_g1_i8.p1  ORF type:complete len:221 (+),score=41.12 TRINITY_DN5131_c0_g1_i8:39-701(+)